MQSNTVSLKTPQALIARLRHQIALRLVALANKIESKDSPAPMPYYRAIDTNILNLGTKHSCDAYSYEYLQSLMKQEGEGYTLGQLFDESGWFEIGPDNIDEVRRDFAKMGIDMDDETGELK